MVDFPKYVINSHPPVVDGGQISNWVEVVLTNITVTFILETLYIFFTIALNRGL